MMSIVSRSTTLPSSPVWRQRKRAAALSPSPISCSPVETLAGIRQGFGLTMQISKIASGAAALALVCLPLVASHLLFYSQLNISPSDVGVDYTDLVQRSTPGLLGMIVFTVAVTLALYSVVVWMNLVFILLVPMREQGRLADGIRLAKRVMLGGFAIAVLLAFTGVLLSVAGWILFVLIFAAAVVGTASLFPARWRDAIMGVLVGAPAYLLFTAVSLLVVLPLFLRHANSPSGELTFAELALGISALIYLPVAYAILFMPILFALAGDPARTAWGWRQVRLVMSHLTMGRAALGFTVFVLVVTHIAIAGLSYWNARAIKEGFDPDIFGAAWLDQAVQHTYGLPVDCVAVTQIAPFPITLPRTALRLGSRREVDYVLVWDQRGGIAVPHDVVRLTPLRRVACVASG
jgi:hypothetical protein